MSVILRTVSARPLYLCLIIFMQGFFISTQAQLARSTVKFGIDNLIDVKFEPLRGKRIALVSNVASRNRFLEETAQCLAKTNALELCALLVPEHGYFAQVPAGHNVAGEIIYGIPTYSLYGKLRRPNRQMIGNCDAVVIDLQDVGIRPYTYISTMYNVMDACAEYGIPCYVLDRPNPLGGVIVDGNIVDDDARSFVSIVPVPYLHGMTIGELAYMINEEGWLPKDIAGKARTCELTVVKMKRWRRDMQWEHVSSLWVPTSPNIPSVNAVRGMALTGLLGELSGISTGIGTTLPFQYLGMPGMSSDVIAQKASQLREYNIKAMPTRFKPMSGRFANTTCEGLFFAFQPNNQAKLYTAAIELMISLRKTHPQCFADTMGVSSPKSQMFVKVSGTKDLYEKLIATDVNEKEIRLIATKGLAEFIEKRKKYLLYN
ncbi:MAG: DUF1343 domain-containing protein [Candidatus Kapabacteria bacterium]|nr:DUF1343 domain-containing protein [Candidatus Kapabacteria bacterium]